MSVPAAAAPPTTVTVDDRDRWCRRGRATSPSPWCCSGWAAAVVAALAGLLAGPVAIAPARVVAALADRLPMLAFEQRLSTTERTILFELRAPRVVLGLAVGALLGGSGAAYQGVFRNPLADPYLLGGRSRCRARCDAGDRHGQREPRRRVRAAGRRVRRWQCSPCWPPPA